MAFGGGGWGTWHTSNVVDMQCPQGCTERHTVDQAVALNERNAEFARARAWKRHKEWVQGGTPRDPKRVAQVRDLQV